MSKTKEVSWYCACEGNYRIKVSNVLTNTWDHCKEGCDLCEESISRFSISWKDSQICEFQVHSENEWEVVKAISEILKGIR